LGEENRIGVLISMAKSLLDYNKIDSLKEVFEKINKVTSLQLIAIANEVMDPKNLSTLIFEQE
jgi:predicted Zn-dependent peptidase